MNDLTKDEIFNILQWGVDKLLNDPMDNETRNLCYKLKSMIDNYCEHKEKT